MIDNVHENVIRELKLKFQDFPSNVIIPPPVFIKMRGTVVCYNLDKGVMQIVFPVISDDLNPFGKMQGGMIAAAIDNTFGPLSMLVGPLNYTRKLEVKYRKSVVLDMGKIIVTAKLIKKDIRRLYFEASVKDALDNELATANAMHWIVD